MPDFRPDSDGDAGNTDGANVFATSPAFHHCTMRCKTCGGNMDVIAKEYFRQWWVIPFVFENVQTMAELGDHRVEFDIPGRRVIRTTEDGPQVIASIHDGCKGSDLRVFRGTIESDDFMVTLKRRHWLSTNMDYEILLKKSGQSTSNMVMKHDTFNSFRVSDAFELRYFREDAYRDFKRQVAGTYVEEHQDLAEIIATLLLHYHYTDNTPG